MCPTFWLLEPFCSPTATRSNLITLGVHQGSVEKGLINGDKRSGEHLPMSNQKGSRSSAVRCTHCESELTVAGEQSLTLKSRPPVEIFALPGSLAVHIVCVAWGTRRGTGYTTGVPYLGEAR